MTDKDDKGPQAPQAGSAAKGDAPQAQAQTPDAAQGGAPNPGFKPDETAPRGPNVGAKPGPKPAANPGRKPGGGGGGPRQGGGPKPGGPKPVVNIRPMAEPAGMKRRHRSILFGFVLFVVVPLIGVTFYLATIAKDQYVSTAGFTVRQEEGASATDLLGGLAQFAGGSTSADGDVLYEFIRSQAMVAKIDEQRDLRSYYSQYWQDDPVFSLWPKASIEDLQWHWDRVVRVSYEQSSGLIEVQVSAFDPEMAQSIATDIVRESQDMVNALNEAARTDSIRYATTDLKNAEERLKRVRSDLTKFRTRTQIVDLESDIQGRMGVMNTLQQQLASELVAFDELSGTASSDDPRVSQAFRRIQVIRDRIAQERSDFATTKVLETGEDYPTLIAEFEGLVVEREFAEQAYRAALTARDSAQAEAIRQSRYLAAYIEPTLAEEAEYPRAFLIFVLAALILTLGWGIIVLVYYSLRDRA